MSGPCRQCGTWSSGRWFRAYLARIGMSPGQLSSEYRLCGKSCLDDLNHQVEVIERLRARGGEGEAHELASN